MRNRFDGGYTSKAINQCVFCKHFKGANATNMVCDAFPNGIPLEIWLERRDHNAPYEGDNGIQFEE